MEPNNIDARPEERWHRTLDNLAREYRNFAARQSELQDRAGYGARGKHVLFGLPGPLIALTVSLITALWPSPESVYVIAPLSMVGGASTLIHNFFDLGGKAQRHWDFAARYDSVCARIDATLARDIDFRTPPDAAFAEWRTDIGHLNASAPQLPGNGCFRKFSGKEALPVPKPAGETLFEVV